jgi:hypothetical protein
MAPRHQRARPHRRYGYWYLVRRVPLEFSAYDTRNPVMLSTGIRVADDPRALVAIAAVHKLDDGLERYGHEKRAGRDADALMRYRQSLEVARKVGISYLPARPLATTPVEQIVERFEPVKSSGADDKPVEVSGVLGGEEPSLGRLIDDVLIRRAILTSGAATGPPLSR